MMWLFLVLGVVFALCYGAWRVGIWSPTLSAALSVGLAVVGWRILLAPDIPVGEGAASGVVFVQLLVWLVGGGCLMLALSMTAGSFYTARSVLSAVILAGLVLSAGTLAYRVTRSRSAAPVAAHAPVVTPRGRRLEGYNYAVEHGIAGSEGCMNVNPDFHAGCLEAAITASATTSPQRRREGQMWAVDNGVASPADCATHPDPDFRAGCLAALHR